MVATKAFVDRDPVLVRKFLEVYERGGSTSVRIPGRRRFSFPVV